jgi:hypothetical protein
LIHGKKKRISQNQTRTPHSVLFWDHAQGALVRWSKLKPDTYLSSGIIDTCSVKPMLSSAKPMVSSVKPMVSSVKPMVSSAKPMVSSAKPMVLSAKPMVFTVNHVFLPFFRQKPVKSVISSRCQSSPN